MCQAQVQLAWPEAPGEAYCPEGEPRCTEPPEFSGDDRGAGTLPSAAHFQPRRRCGPPLGFYVTAQRNPNCSPAFPHSRATRLSSSWRTCCFPNNLFHTQLLPSLPGPHGCSRSTLPPSVSPVEPPRHPFLRASRTSSYTLSAMRTRSSHCCPTQPPPPESPPALSAQPSSMGCPKLRGPGWGAAPSLTALRDTQAGGLL